MLIGKALAQIGANVIRIVSWRALQHLLVGFNGQAAGKSAPQFGAAGYRTVVLPSTSPAHASLSFDRKLETWQLLLQARKST